MLGLLRAEMVKNTCFQSNIVLVTYGETMQRYLSQNWKVLDLTPSISLNS